MNFNWPTSASVEWMRQILQERFGYDFCIRIVEDGCIRLAYGSDLNYVDLVLNPANFNQASSDLPCSEWNASAEGWLTALTERLPAPGVSNLPHPLVEQISEGFCIRYDILGFAYWMLSRQEEVDCRDLDEHGRFPATSSHAFKHSYLERPLVDEWFYILGQVIQKNWPAISLKVPKFSTKVSHDVDEPSRYAFRSAAGVIRAVAGDLIKRGNFKSVLVAPLVRRRKYQELHRFDPANTFDWIMKLSERHSLISAFYFICGRTDPVKDADYEPEDLPIRKLMRQIHSRGHEIGLHPSYGTYKSPQQIISEANRLRRIADEEGITQDVWGGRMHYLRWEQPTTLRAWEQANMNYDSSLGYADRPGFRCGTCFEYPAFDPVVGEILNLRIRPLIAMECTVISSKYLGLGASDRAFAKFIKLKNSCKAVGGCFTLLWHNSSFGSLAERKLYELILEE